MSTERDTAARLRERGSVLARLIADQLLELRDAGEPPLLIENGRPTLLGSYLESYEETIPAARGKVS